MQEGNRFDQGDIEVEAEVCFDKWIVRRRSGWLSVSVCLVRFDDGTYYSCGA